jgi:excisionase family DNA binding protein
MLYIMPRKKTTIKLPNLLTISQVAQILNLTTTTLRRWDDSGIFKAIRVGKRGDRRYRNFDVINALKNGIKDLK